VSDQVSEVVSGAAFVEGVEVRDGEGDVEVPQVLDGHDVGHGLGLLGGVGVIVVLGNGHVLVDDSCGKNKRLKTAFKSMISSY
jgi:hypothetical protein